MGEPVKLELPPGLVRGLQSDYAVAGRYYDVSHVRWDVKGKLVILKPMKGWEVAFPASSLISGLARGAHAWLDNDEAPWAMIGTHENVYAHDGSALSNITPVGYGPGGAHTATLTMGNFGELGVFVMDDEGVIYEYQPGGGGVATAMTNAPACKALFVTDEKFLVALAKNGDPRELAWCDQENRTVWTATALNQAGDLPINEVGALMCGGKVKGGGLVHTTTGCHYMRSLGRPDVYGIEHVANGCGIISRNGGASAGSMRMWMGKQAFHGFRGYHEILDCDISDDVFGHINEDHQHKVWAFEKPDDQEVWFAYPRDEETECSHAAVYNYNKPHWNHTELPRLAGFNNEVFGYPVHVTAQGRLMAHDTDWEYSEEILLTADDGTTILYADDGITPLEADDSGEDEYLPYAKSGPFEIGTGERRMQVDEVWPDEMTLGDVNVYIHCRESPNATLTTLGPYTNAARLGVFTTARQVSIEFRADNDTEDFRIGLYRASIGAARGRH